MEGIGDAIQWMFLKKIQELRVKLFHHGLDHSVLTDCGLVRAGLGKAPPSTMALVTSG